MITLLHLGDLHLGSHFSLLPRDAAEAFKEAQFKALEKTIKEGCARGAQLLLLAGDVFDTPFPQKELADRFFSLIGRLGLPTVIAPGNHDYYTRGGVYDRDDLPKNLSVFTDEALAAFEFPSYRLRVYGYAFVKETHPSVDLQGIETPEGFTSLLLAHGDTTSPISSYAPIATGALASSGLSYAALGHIHNPPPQRRYGNTLAAYSGFFTSRGFDECGQGQCMLVTIDRIATVEPLFTDAPEFHTEVLDATGAESTEELAERIRDFLKSTVIPASHALRLSLIGEVGLDCTAPSAEHFDAAFAHFECKDETIPVYGAEYLEKDPSIRGAFYRALLPHLQSDSSEERRDAALALRLGFAALSGREVLP